MTREIPENYYRFVLFDSPQMGNIITPASSKAHKIAHHFRKECKLDTSSLAPDCPTPNLISLGVYLIYMIYHELKP